MARKSTTPILENKKRRVETDSHYPIHLLSPKSNKKRMANLRIEKIKTNMKMKRLLERVEYYHVQLAGEQSEDMSAFLSMVCECL